MFDRKVEQFKLFREFDLDGDVFILIVFLKLIKKGYVSLKDAKPKIKIIEYSQRVRNQQVYLVHGQG